MPVIQILLVSFSSRGHQLVYFYPEQGSDTNTRQASDSKTNILGFNNEFLADILSPKSSLCDQKFHLRVHEIDFVGYELFMECHDLIIKNARHPTLLNVDRPGTGLIYSRVNHSN